MSRLSRSVAALAMALSCTMLAASLRAQSSPAARSAIRVADAWVRVPPAATPMTAGYMTLENLTDREQEIVAASSPAAARVELHEMRDHDGRATMRMVERIVIPAKGKVALAPGGLHLMLMQLPRPLAAGDTVAISLRLKDGRVVEVSAPVRPRA